MQSVKPNDSIAAKFWVDKNYQTLPYKRGFIYAFYFDNQIRLASGGKRSIRDFLLELFKRNKEVKSADPEAYLTLNDYITAASKFIPEKQVRQEIETYMIKGVPLDFRKIKLIDGFKIGYQDSIPVLKVGENTDLKKVLGGNDIFILRQFKCGHTGGDYKSALISVVDCKSRPAEIGK